MCYNLNVITFHIDGLPVRFFIIPFYQEYHQDLILFMFLFYRIAVHYKYLSALLEKLDLPQKVTFVIHDWGSALGFHWCNMHRDRVKVGS